MPETNPYDRFRGRELSATDVLALDRTLLANERTLLSYLRTALALVVVGGSVFKFFGESWMYALGAVFIIAGGLTFVIGIARFRRTAARLAMLKTEQNM